MPRTKRMPAFSKVEQWRKDAERDARALILAAKLGCSFPEAVAAIMDGGFHWGFSWGELGIDDPLPPFERAETHARCCTLVHDGT